MSLCKCESENEKRWHGNMFKNEYFSTSCEMKAWFCDDGVTLIPVLAHITLIYIFFCSEKTKVLFILPLPLIEFLCFILTRWESNFTLLLCVYFLAIFYLCAISFKRISEVLIIRCCCCCILINDRAVNGSIAEI